MIAGQIKTAIKYGAVIALGVGLWVLADHFLLHMSRPGSKTAFLTPLFFNLLQLVVLFLGIRATRQANQGRLTLGQGIGCGLAISLAYAVFALIFFLSFYWLVGSKVLDSDSALSGSDRPDKYVLLAASAGLFFTAMIGGLIYSAVISFALRTTPSAASGSRPRPQVKAPRRRR